MVEEERLVFVNLNTDTVEDMAGDAYVIDPETAVLSDGERDVLDVADQYGSFGPAAADIVRRIGVPVADLWAAYKREQKRTRELCPVGELAGDPHEYIAGDGVVIPWDVAGDPRPNVEACRGCVSVIDQDYDNTHRCESCGVTGGGVEGGLCEECWGCAKDSGEGPVLCDQCGEPCHADDAVTDGVVALCGSFRGNGCADMIDAHE